MKMIVLENGMIDLALGPKGLLAEETLESAIYISLLTDRRARADDRLPYEAPSSLIPPDRRGWCGDALANIEGDRIGSRLWLLSREKVTEETRRRAIAYCREALQWMLEDNVATAIDVEAEWNTQEQIPGRLDVLIGITLPDGAYETYSLTLPIGV